MTWKEDWLVSFVIVCSIAIVLLNHWRIATLSDRIDILNERLDLMTRPPNPPTDFRIAPGRNLSGGYVPIANNSDPLPPPNE